MAQSELTAHMEEEIFTIMHMVAEMGLEIGGAHTFEGEVDELESDEEDEQQKKERGRIAAAEKLVKAADEYDKAQLEKRKQKQFEDEIVGILRERGDEAQRLIESLLPPIRITDVMFETGMLGTVYGTFRTKMENFIGGGQPLSQMAVVSSVTQGVVRAFKDTSSAPIYLVSSLASKFIKDKYGSYIAEHGGLTKLVTEGQ